MDIRNILPISGFAFVIILGCLFLLPESAFAQRKRDCHTCTDNQADLPDSQRIMRANARRGNRVPLSTSRTSRRPDRRPLLPFIMNKPTGPLRPSDRDRFYGIGALEVGANMGTAHVLTDVSGKWGSFPSVDHFLLTNASFAGGVFSRYRINEWVGFSFGADLARLNAGSDMGFAYTYVEQRDVNGIETTATENIYSFSNNIAEFSGKLEFHSPPLGRSAFNLYAFAGFSAFFSSPQLYNQQGEPIVIPRMRILLTNPNDPLNPREVTPDTPSNLHYALPLGGGLTVMMANFVRIGFEIGYRYTGNHGLDGAYVLDTPYDSFVFTTFRIGYVFPMMK